jgi:acyl-CoA synthetase (AMP-forming)/AMP-acid ligase II
MSPTRTLGARFDADDGLARYDCAVATNLVEMLERTVAAHGPDRSFIDAERSVTWSEFAEIVRHTARGLAGEHVVAGDRVAVVAGNGIPLAAAYWAIWRLGAIAVPLNHRLIAPDLATQLRDSGSKLLLIGRGKEELGAAASGLSETPGYSQGEDEYFFSSKDGAHFDAPTIDESTPAAIMYTSGTTGAAKGVVISHGNAIQNSVTCTEVIGRTHEDVELIMVPQFNVTGLCSQTIPVVQVAMTAVLLDGFNADRVVELVRAHSVTSTVGAPTMWWRILESAGTAGLPSLRLALYGGAPMPSALLTRMRTALHSATFGNGYGMTETCSMVSYLGGEDALLHPESVGRPLPVTELRILDPERDADVEAGAVGEVTVRGPQVGVGYWVDGEVRPFVSSDGWLRTGDAARVVDGLIVLADRLKDVIKRGGESIFSVEVEEVLYQHPQILEAAVLGVPDDVFGEKTLAVVVTKPGSTISPDDVQRHCKASLAQFKVPSYVEFVDELPRNAGGKVVKSLLKERFVSPSGSGA